AGGETGEGLPIVLGDAKVDSLSSTTTHKGLQGEAVGAHDLIGAPGITGHDHFIARSENGNPGAPSHRQPGMIHGGRKADVANSEPTAGREAALARRKIQSRRADIATWGHGLPDFDPGSFVI